jgi:hypothetical protein
MLTLCVLFRLRPPMTVHMSPSSSDRKSNAAALLAPGPLLLVAMILLAALSRLLPHPPNFSPVEAMALFGGAYFANRAWALLVPLMAMVLSDVALGLSMGGEYWSYVATSMSFWSVYLCIALSTVMGFGLRGKVGSANVLGYSLAGSILFFAVTNGVTWLGSTMYPQTGAGLVAAYVAGIPFFQWTVMGTLFYSAMLFGGFALLRRQAPSLQAQTV